MNPNMGHPVFKGLLSFDEAKNQWVWEGTWAMSDAAFAYVCRFFPAVGAVGAVCVVCVCACVRVAQPAR